MDKYETRHNALAGFSLRDFAKEVLEGDRGHVAKRENCFAVLRGFKCGNGTGGQQIVCEVTAKGPVPDGEEGNGLYQRILQLPEGNDPRDVDWVVGWGLLHLPRLRGVL